MDDRSALIFVFVRSVDIAILFCLWISFNLQRVSTSIHQYYRQPLRTFIWTEIFAYKSEFQIQKAGVIKSIAYVTPKNMLSISEIQIKIALCWEQWLKVSSDTSAGLTTGNNSRIGFSIYCNKATWSINSLLLQTKGVCLGRASFSPWCSKTWKYNPFSDTDVCNRKLSLRSLLFLICSWQETQIQDECKEHSHHNWW